MERCVNTLILKNEDRKTQKLKRNLSEGGTTKKIISYNLDSNDKSINKNIKPKYLFTEAMLNKLYKLRDIFLEFDMKNSGKY